MYVWFTFFDILVILCQTFRYAFVVVNFPILFCMPDIHHLEHCSLGVCKNDVYFNSWLKDDSCVIKFKELNIA